MKETLLSIVVITMNRSEQLIEAIDSCLRCDMPSNTEIVIINNASTDNTDVMIKRYIKLHKEIRFVYELEPNNLGVGGGRNRGFELSSGKYVYFLDDDAVIDSSCRKTFFMKTIEYMDRNENIASVTTRIYDELFKCDRDADEIDKKIDGYNCVFKFLGGSHFLRKASFSTPLYFNIVYGSEEYAPSIKAYEMNFFNVYDKSISIIHKPKINKWKSDSNSMKYIQIRAVSVVYATKRILYPKIFFPVLYAGYRKRCNLYLAQHTGAREEADRIVRELINDNCEKKIRVKTVIKMFRMFGITVF